jgi:hypothetical protein
MTTAIKGIQNSHLIESIFGGWPSFHDAEIHSLLLTRDCELRPQMDVIIHHWEMTSDVDTNGYYVLKHHTLSTLRFSGVTDLMLAGFNNQNVLSELEISELNGAGSGLKYSVAMPTSYGCEASFNCKEISILSSVPFLKD